MSAGVGDTTAGSWRPFEPADLPFLYELICRVDPRWWRFNKDGLEPSTMLSKVQAVSAAVVVFDGDGNRVAAGILAETGAAGTGTIEYFALPDPDSERVARQQAGAIITAAFDGAPIRRLYHERFEGDADVLGDIADLWELEVTFPEFALVAGTYEARTISVLTREGFEAWRS